jgi:hypothetical protein
VEHGVWDTWLEGVKVDITAEKRKIITDQIEKPKGGKTVIAIHYPRSFEKKLAEFPISERHDELPFSLHIYSSQRTFVRIPPYQPAQKTHLIYCGRKKRSLVCLLLQPIDPSSRKS